MKRVAIIGAGVLGASTAHHLAGRAEVFLIDAGEVGDGTTGRSYSRLSAWGKQPDSYFRLNHEGMRAHAAFPGDWYHPCGTLLTGSAADRAQAVRLGYAVESVDDDRVFLPEEGWVDAPLYARSLAALSGASVMTGCSVTGLRPGWEVVFDRGSLHADVVVNTAGNGAARIAAMAGHSLTLVPSFGMLVELSAPAHPLRHIVHTDDVTLRPLSADRLLLRGPSADAALSSGLVAASELILLATKVVPWLESATIHDVRIGSRVIPRGGLPSVGAVPGVDGYLHAVAHSGVILAPVIGKHLAELALT
ncbi:NAD(P)/FAD-dependent oxidoreductase [Lentzea tibetensis]|uniref:NAD(P)/FAD-dependent oxidoreductase n=1 Tax=Lentzea tibetensis TaxID=2591470 RepID=UPI0016472B98|nr:FAD-dependent oxidoreductase [Lentzea tibetensis]